MLFADIVSSTEQIAHLDPEEAMERLQPAVQIMCDAVERFGGTVVRTLGDGVMAIFGVPKALEGHAALACEAALNMQSTFEASTEGIRIRVGLHSGQVASDPHATDGSKGGGAHGLTIHLASRVVAVADPGRIFLTADCYALIRVSFDVQPMGQQVLKGLTGPVDLFALNGVKAAFASQNFHRTTLTPFRGRSKEIAAMQLAQQQTESGQTRIVGVSGAPGTGKSRLCYEFAQSCRARNIPVFEVRAQLFGNATPLQPVLELMRTFFFFISPSDSATIARNRIAQRLASVKTLALDDQFLLNEFLGVADVDDPPVTLSPKARRARLLGIVSTLVKSSGADLAVILIEDLHWLDEASEEFVAALVDAVQETRTMLVLNYRPSYRAPWARLDHFQQIDLAELSSVDTDALVRELISHRRELQDISQMVARRSGGNPFFAEELVRALAETGALSGDMGAVRARGIDSMERTLPATVQAVIGARVDRLVESEKALLQTCAILGKEFPLAVLEAVVRSQDPAQLARGLDDLCRAELLQPQPAVGGRRYAFRHPLIQEVAYGSQLKVRRSGIHAQVAVAMEAHFEDRLDEFAALIGYHYDAAGKSEEAARCEVRAARWVGVTNSAQAIKHWRRAWDLMGAVPRSEDNDRQRAMAGGQIGVLGWREGLKVDEVKPVIDQAIRLAQGKDDQLVQLLMIVDGRIHVSAGGSVDEYVECARRAVALTSPQDVGRRAMLMSLLSQALGWAGQLEAALIANNEAMSTTDCINEFDRAFVGLDIEQWLRAMRARLLIRLGDFAAATSLLDEFMAGQGRSDPVIQTIGHLGCVELAISQHDVALADRHATILLDQAEKSQVPYLRVFGLSYWAAVQSLLGNGGLALAKVDEALLLVREASVAMEHEPELLELLADTQLRVGNAEQAVRVARECVALARKRSTRIAELRGLVTLSRALIANGADATRIREAQESCSQAEALMTETGAIAYANALDAARTELREWADARQLAVSVAN